jgi:transcriptional regulator of heat shock response
MFHLEDEGFLQQPHISAGRIPTAKGYRAYVKQFMEPSSQEKEVRKKFASLQEQYFQKKDQERVYEAVSLLSSMVPNVAFASVPYKERVYFMGLANVLKQPEFQANPELAMGVAEVLEEHLHTILENVETDDQVRYYIGEEHILPQFQSCSMVVTSYGVRDERGVVGILGPMRMDYAYNTVVLELITELLNSGRQ